jgi:predicted transcriptional regulator
MATLTVRLPEALRRDLDRLARQRGRPAGELVRDSLEKYLAVARFRALREKTLPRAARRGFLVDEDVHEKIS